MTVTDKRRAFLQKLGALSMFSLLGSSHNLASTIDSSLETGFVLRASEGEVRYIGNTRKATVLLKVSKSADYTPEMSLLSEVIVPRDGIPEHKHLNEEEFLYVQHGTIQIKINDTIIDGKTGDLIYVPKNTWHGFSNNGQQDVTLLFGYSPAGFEDYFRAIGTTDIDAELNFSKEDWVRTNKKYGVVYR